MFARNRSPYVFARFTLLALLALLPATLIVLALATTPFAPPAEAQQEACIKTDQRKQPRPPQNVTVTPGDGRLLVAWDAPAQGSAPCVYHVWWMQKNENDEWPRYYTTSNKGYTAPGARKFVIAGLANGRSTLVNVESVIPQSWNAFGPVSPRSTEYRSHPDPKVYATPRAPAVKSSDATLDGIYLIRQGGGLASLSPAFAGTTTAYTAAVPESVEWVTVWPLVNEFHASYEIEHTKRRVSGRSWRQVDLEKGVPKVIRIWVTAHDGTKKTYRVTVTRRDPADASLRGLTVSDGTNPALLTPSFAPAVTAYTASVGSSVTSVTVTPTVNMSGATVTVDGAAVSSGSASSPIALTAGQARTIDIVVTAPNGQATRTYRATVTRQESSDATLSALKLSDGTNWAPLTPAFNASTTGYAATVAHSVASVTVWPTVSQSGATVTVDGSAVNSGSSSSRIALTAGEHRDIAVAVTAQDSSTNTYTIRVTRRGSSDATLSALTVEEGTNNVALTPVFSPAVSHYTASVSTSVAYVSVTPTVSQNNASVSVNGNPVISGSASSPVALIRGEENDISVIVTAQDGSIGIYRVTVTRPLPVPAGPGSVDDGELFVAWGIYRDQEDPDYWYDVEYRESGDAEWQRIGAFPGDAYIIHHLKNGVAYDVRVVAYSDLDHVFSKEYAEVSQTVAATPNGSVTDLYEVGYFLSRQELESGPLSEQTPLVITGSDGNRIQSMAACSSSSTSGSKAISKQTPTVVAGNGQLTVCWAEHPGARAYEEKHPEADAYEVRYREVGMSGWWKKSVRGETHAVLSALNNGVLHEVRVMAADRCERHEHLKKHGNPCMPSYSGSYSAYAAPDGSLQPGEWDQLATPTPGTWPTPTPLTPAPGVESRFSVDPVVTPGDGQLTISWLNGEKPGAYHIVWHVEAEDMPAHKLYWAGEYAEEGSSHHTVYGLTNGVAYAVLVTEQYRDEARRGQANDFPVVKGIPVPAPTPTPVPPTPTPVPPTPTPTPVPEPGTYSVSASARVTEGNSAALTITLSEAAPSSGVEFTVTPGYDATAEVGDVETVETSLTVNAGDDTQQINIAIVDDDVDEDDETFTITVAASTSGWERAGNGRDTATVTIVDNDTAGVTVTPTTLTVAEDGSATYTVVLDSRPTHDVTVAPTASDGGAASVAPATHTIGPSDWNVAKTFTVRGVADDDRNDESVSIAHRATGTDAKYAATVVSAVRVAVTDTTPAPTPTPTPTPVPAPTTDPPEWESGAYLSVSVSAQEKEVSVSWPEVAKTGGPVVDYYVCLKPEAPAQDVCAAVASKHATYKIWMHTFSKLDPGLYSITVAARNSGGESKPLHETANMPAS